MFFFSIIIMLHLYRNYWRRCIYDMYIPYIYSYRLDEIEQSDAKKSVVCVCAVLWKILPAKQIKEDKANVRNERLRNKANRENIGIAGNVQKWAQIQWFCLGIVNSVFGGESWTICTRLRESRESTLFVMGNAHKRKVIILHITYHS